MTPNNEASQDRGGKIPEDEIKRIAAAARASVSFKGYPQPYIETAYTSGYTDGAKAEYLRHLSTPPSSASSQGWISVNEKRPSLVPGMNCSQNVLASSDDGRLMVMNYSWIEDGEQGGYAWCNCYGDINGDGEFDDDYKITHWMPLPELPSISPSTKSEK